MTPSFRDWISPASVDPERSGWFRRRSRFPRWELDKIRTADRQPLDPLPAADFTVVEYWAEWCLPCHAQARDMARVLAGHPDLRVNLLHVEADLKKLKPEVVRVPEEKGQGQALR